MRILAILLLLPLATAGFGPYEDGWPINIEGESTQPGDPLNQVNGNTIYPYWPLLSAEVIRLAQDHPDRVKLYTAGQSTAGLDLYMLEIADFSNAGSADFVPLEEREVIWLDGGTHSNEYSGVYFTLAFAQYLVEEFGSDEFATWAVANRHTWVMPMVNPDGSNAFGRLNANLVNINRNYPVIWGGQGTSDLMNNPGPSPASEIETKINIEWFERTMPDYYASIHCCGNLWLYPYGEDGIDPVDEPMLSRICDEVFAQVRSDCGPIWSTIYPASGSSVDTAYEMTGAVAFGFEMSGRGARALWGQPVTFDSVRIQERESWGAIVHAYEHVHLYGAHPAVTALGDVIAVQNIGWGNMTNTTLTLQMNGETRIGALNLTSNGTQYVAVPAGSGTLNITVDYQKRLETKNLVAPSYGQMHWEFAVQNGSIGVQGVQEGQESPGLGLLVLIPVALALLRRKR